MTNFDKVKQQKLIIKYNDGATVFFHDEKQEQHQHDYSGGEIVDLYQLVVSCFEPIEDESILTCGCGWPECAGFYGFKSIITETEILWDIDIYDDEKDLFRFDKNQYIDEVKKTLEDLLKHCKNGFLEDKYGEYFKETLTKETLTKYYGPFVNPSLIQGKSLPRHKIIIKPGDKYIYVTEDGKKVFIKNKDLTFKDTDIFDEPLIYSFNATNIKKWYDQMNDENIDWKKWNEEGIKISQYLRDSLPKAFDIWYQYQNFENNEIIHIPIESQD